MDIPEEHPIQDLLPLHVEEGASDVIILTSDQWNEFTKERRTDRKVRFWQSIFLGIAVVTGVWLSRASFYEERDRKNLVAGTQTLLRQIDEQTSPERQAAQDKAVADIIVIVDCNNRRAMQEALDQIQMQRPDLFSRILLTSDCPQGD